MKKSDFQNEIVQLVKTIRDQRGYSQAYVAILLGISPGQLGNIESGKRPHKYTLKQLYVLSKEFDVNVSSFFFLNLESEQVYTENALIEKIIEYQDK